MDITVPDILFMDILYIKSFITAHNVFHSWMLLAYLSNFCLFFIIFFIIFYNILQPPETPDRKNETRQAFKKFDDTQSPGYELNITFMPFVHLRLKKNIHMPIRKVYKNTQGVARRKFYSLHASQYWVQLSDKQH